MVNLLINKGGVIIVNSVLMGTPKKLAIDKLKAAGYGIKDDGDSIRVGLLANNIPPDSLDALHLNLNDLGDVCDGYVFHTQLSYNDAYKLQMQYVEMVDRLKITKTLRGSVVTNSIVYSYTNTFFKVEIARWREGGESADIPTNINDYAVSVFITSLVEEVKTITEMKRLVYNNTGVHGHNHKALWLSIILIGVAVSVYFLSMLWPVKNHNYKPVETKKIGKYVYIDMAKVLHTKIDCSSVFKNRSSQMVHPIMAIEISSKEIENVCSRCVTQEQIDSLRWIVEHNNDGFDIDVDYPLYERR